MPRPRRQVRDRRTSACRTAPLPRTGPAAVLVEPVAEVCARVPGAAGGPGGGGRRPARRACGTCTAGGSSSGSRITARPPRSPGLTDTKYSIGARHRLEPVHVVGHRERRPGRRRASWSTFHDAQARRFGAAARRVGVEDDLVRGCTRTRRAPSAPPVGVAEAAARVVRMRRHDHARRSARCPASAVRTVTPSGRRVTSTTGSPVRTARRERRTSLSTYATSHRGSSATEALPTPISPWLSRNRSR